VCVGVRVRVCVSEREKEGTHARETWREGGREREKRERESEREKERASQQEREHMHALVGWVVAFGVAAIRRLPKLLSLFEKETRF